MEILEYIQHQMAGMRRAVNNVMNDMTPDMFNGATPGTANAISATFVHFLHSEDNFIHKIIQDKPGVWESGGWSEKTGIPKPPGIREDWSSYKGRQTPIQPLLEYQAAVWAATDAYLATLTPQDLDRKVQFAGGERLVGDMLLLLVSQELGHAGEIAALKGVQGGRGLPI